MKSIHLAITLISLFFIERCVGADYMPRSQVDRR